MRLTYETRALPLVLIFEGGYVDNKLDHGGKTNHGITQFTYDNYQQAMGKPISDVKDIPMSLVEAIYLNYYWMPALCDQLPENLDIVMFDTCVLSGVLRAKYLLQTVLNVKVDGIIGPQTLLALKSVNAHTIASNYITAKKSWYSSIVAHDPGQSVFLGGWGRRADYMLAYISGGMSLDQIRSAW